MRHLLRELPPVHELQKDNKFPKLIQKFKLSNAQVTQIIQDELAILRQQLVKGDDNLVIELSNQTVSDYIWNKVEESVFLLNQDRLTTVINGTGTVLHTNLGRARLSDEAIHHVARVAGNYSNLEYQIKEGKRGSRHAIIEDLLVKVTGAEAAMVVNNNAAAVYLVLRALAREKEVIVSRGQLVEIGGSFRVSSIMEESGAKLVEVGTTNKTHPYDYERAINVETAMILKVHTSNFKTIGFTESVATDVLVELAQKQEDVIFYEDLGSGSLFDFKKQGIGDEPLVKEVIEAGADLVTFSGDKLLGGPQAGIIAGKKELIQQLKSHQLARVLRVDKMTFAGLEKTLRAYLGGEASQELPTVRDIIKSIDEITEQAESFITHIVGHTSNYSMELQENTSQVGGGTMPGVELDTIVVAIKHQAYSAHELAEKLRKGDPAIIVRIKDEKVLLDFRTITEQEEKNVIHAFLALV